MNENTTCLYDVLFGLEFCISFQNDVCFYVLQLFFPLSLSVQGWHSVA